ncbi:MAG: PT domain-containing protein [Ruminococcus sp.]
MKMKKFLAVLLSVLMLASVMSVAAVNVSASSTVYVDVTGASTGEEDYWAWIWNEGSEGNWSQMTKDSQGYYEVSMEAGQNVVFVRMPAGVAADWDAKWNQTGDTSFDGTNNLCTITWADSYGGDMGVSWSQYSGGGNPTTPIYTDAPTQPATGSGNGKYVLVCDNGDLGYFENGTITYNFAETTYVWIRNYDTGVQYCTDGWQGLVQSVTLVNESVTSEFNKLGVPAGTQTLTLVDNGNDTFTLSYGDAPTPTQAPTTPIYTDAPTQPATGSGNGKYVLVCDNGDLGYFENGTITYNFAETTYVWIRNYDTGVQYCTDGWQGLVQSVTLVNESVASEFNKLGVPAGTQTLTLVDNGNDTLTLSYGDGPVPTIPIPTEAPTQEPTEAPTEKPTEVPTQAPTQAPTEQPTTEDATTSDNLTVRASSNLNSNVQSVQAEGNKVTVIYDLTSKDKIVDGQGVVSYDTSKLFLDPADNSQAVMFPLISANLVSNINASGNTVKFNFTGIDNDTKQGKYDFTNGGTLIALTFTVKDGVSGIADVKLTIEELDSIDTTYVTNSVVSAEGVADIKLDSSIMNGQILTTPATEATTNVTEATQTTDTTEPTTSSETVPVTDSTEATQATESTAPSETVPVTESTESTQSTTQAPTQPTTQPATQAPTQKPTSAPATQGGQSVSKVTDTIAKTDTDNGDVKGSKFAPLKVKAVSTKNKTVKLTWSKVSGAKGYIIYGANCGKTMKKLKTTTAKSYTLKNLKKGKYYKYMVVAYKTVNGKQVVTSISKITHVAVKGGKYGNATKITVKKISPIKKGKKATIKATVKNSKKNVKTHVKLRYESTNTKIATVTSKGKITAKKKGTCYVYVYAQNGVCKKVKITVK